MPPRFLLFARTSRWVIQELHPQGRQYGRAKPDSISWLRLDGPPYTGSTGEVGGIESRPKRRPRRRLAAARGDPGDRAGEEFGGGLLGTRGTLRQPKRRQVVRGRRGRAAGLPEIILLPLISPAAAFLAPATRRRTDHLGGDPSLGPLSVLYAYA